MTATRQRIVTVLGTRPEAIKLAPVIRALDAAEGFDPFVVATAQHREMLDQVLNVFSLEPERDLDLMREDQGVAEFTSRALAEVTPALAELEPDLVLVQGDTSTAMVSALAAFYEELPVGHVEAGLRSLDKWSPFPEEMNRQIIGRIADLHFAPTNGNRGNLLAEGVNPDAVHVTGNPVVDAVQWIAEKSRAEGDVTTRLLPGFDRDSHRLVLVTLHRRESFGDPLATICASLRRIVDDHPDVVMAYPVHPNPRVRETVVPRLDEHDRVHLLDPLGYRDFVGLMDASHLILTDSGGVQEEAPSLGIPTLVLRDVTERPEAVEDGAVRLVGRDPDEIRSAADELLNNPEAHGRMSAAGNPYGDGRAAERIVEAVRRFLESSRSG